jgi:murein tripeptide amidase MpaA
LQGITARAQSTSSPALIEMGRTVQGRPILAYRFGDGPMKRALIGGIHGGYEINTIQLMSETIAYLSTNPGTIPEHITLFVVPAMNIDGAVAGTDRIRGRLNANRVDLNRNWDYKWSAQAFHGRWPVSGGSAPFSEPETRAVRDFIINENIDAVIFYHSAYPAVFAGANRDVSQSVSLAQAVAGATGYPYRPAGIPGQVMTGNAIDWLTGQGIHAIEIELTNHRDTDWLQNLRGIREFLEWEAALSEESEKGRK